VEVDYEGGVLFHPCDSVEESFEGDVAPGVRASAHQDPDSPIGVEFGAVVLEFFRGVCVRHAGEEVAFAVLASQCALGAGD